MNEPDNGALLVDLQSRLAYQEDTLEKLDAAVAEQEQRIARLTAAVERLSRRIDSAAGASSGASDPDG